MRGSGVPYSEPFGQNTLLFEMDYARPAEHSHAVQRAPPGGSYSLVSCDLVNDNALADVGDRKL
jgi:hypothetical protein